MSVGALLGLGQVQHTRLRPARHGFRYPTYFLMLPMRRLQREPEAWGAVAHNRFGLIGFRDRDHGDGGPSALAWAERCLAEHGVADADGEFWLHCYPRVAGYSFKPVSFWYAHRANGSLAAVLVEVNNTFGERHCYLLQPEAPGGSVPWGHERRATKVFHVSPFCRVAGEYRFRFLRTDAATLQASPHPAGAPLRTSTEMRDAPPPPRTVVRIEHHDEGGPLLLTSVSGALAPATAERVRQAFWGLPLMTWGVIARIHWQALLLLSKRVPFFRKPEPPGTFVTR